MKLLTPISDEKSDTDQTKENASLSFDFFIPEKLSVTGS